MPPVSSGTPASGVLASHEALREGILSRSLARGPSVFLGGTGVVGQGEGFAGVDGGCAGVLVVASPSLMREAVLEGMRACKVCRDLTVVASVAEALRRAVRHSVEVVLLEVSPMCDPGGWDGVRSLAEAFPRAQVLVWTECMDPGGVVASLELGAGGYLLKSAPVSEVLQAIQDAHRGGASFSPAVARLVVLGIRARRAVLPAEHLTAREAEILALVAKGYLNKEIACRLCIGFETVRSHLKSIFEKLHVRSRTAAAVKYFRDTVSVPPVDAPAAGAAALSVAHAAASIPRNRPMPRP